MYNLLREKLHEYRENLITCEQINEPAYALLMEYTHSVVKALWLTKGDIRQHYATLPGCTELYGKHTQTRTFEHHANLLAYMANRPLCTMENGF